MGGLLMYRSFLYNGQVTDRIDTYEDAGVLSSDADAAQEVATALGVDATTITVQHAATVPAVTVTIPPAAQPAPDGPTLAERVDAIYAALTPEVQSTVTTSLSTTAG